MKAVIHSLLMFGVILFLTACGGGGVGVPAFTGKAWGTPQIINTGYVGGASNPQIAIDANGNAIAVWVQFDGQHNHITANHYTRGGSWATAQPIDPSNALSVAHPQIAAQPNGNAIAVWEQHDGTHYNIWANRYTAGGSWGTPQLIETDDTGDAISAQIAVDTLGNAIAVWQQHDGTRYNIWANRYTAGSGWGAAQLIESDNTGIANQPQVAFDTVGNAIAIWTQVVNVPFPYTGQRSAIRANRYTVGVGWGGAAQVDFGLLSGQGSTYPQIAFDAVGNAIAVWQQSDGLRDSIWANRYSAGSWGAPLLIEADNNNSANSPQVAIDRDGNAIAVWEQYDGMRYNIWANRYTAGTGWDTAQLIESDNSGSANGPRVAADRGGNAVAVWSQTDGASENIWANHYTAGSGWGAARLVERDDSVAYDPRVAVDSEGNAIAVWEQGSSIWVNHYR